MSPAEKDPDCREVIDLTMSYIFPHAKMEDGGVEEVYILVLCLIS